MIRSHSVHTLLTGTLRSLHTLVHICTQSVHTVVSLLTVHTAEGPFSVHTLLTRTRAAVFTLIHICTLSVGECVSWSTGHTAIRSHSVHTHLTRTLRRLCTLVYICAGVVVELVTVVTDAAVASRCVFTATVGAGSLTTLVDVCTQSVEQSVSRLTGHAAVRALTVDTLLTWTLQSVLTLVHVCAGVAAEPVTKATDTPVAAWSVVTATVAAGILQALVDVLTTGLLAAAPVSRRTHAPEASHGVHTLSHCTHTWRLHTLIHIYAVRAVRVGLVSLITHTGVFSTWLIHTAATPTHTWSALTHTSHWLDSGRSSRHADSWSALQRRELSAGPRPRLRALWLGSSRQRVPSGCWLNRPGHGGGLTPCLTPHDWRLWSWLCCE